MDVPYAIECGCPDVVFTAVKHHDRPNLISLFSEAGASWECNNAFFQAHFYVAQVAD